MITCFLWCIIKKTKMNLKERGFTVGDLAILLIIVFLSFFIINKFKESTTETQINTSYRLEKLKDFNA